MAAGRPIVATAAGGIVEMIQDGVTGLLVPVVKHKDGRRAVDVGKLTESQLELLNNRERAECLGMNGQQRVIKEFSWERMTDSTLKVYRQVSRGSAEF
jgi:glycosyltransferase involved in cell wall biosynthesis